MSKSSIQLKIQFPNYPLYPPLNEAMHGVIKNIELPPIVPTSQNYRVDTLEKITDVYSRTGKLYVYDGYSDCTIWGSPEENIIFRAWHDYIHIKEQLDFTPEGEHYVMVIQQKQVQDYMTAAEYPANVIDICVNLLEAEVDGQVQYLSEHGSFPEDQVQFTQQHMHKKGYSL